MAMTPKKPTPKATASSKVKTKSVERKIGEALTTKKLRDTVVWQDKNQPAMFNEKSKTKNIRKKLDADKTSMRAKIIESRITKNVPKLKNEANTMVKKKK